MQQLIDLMYPSHSPERRKLRERWNEQDSLSWEKYLESYSFYRANALIWNFANNVNRYEYLYRTNSYHKDWNWLMPVVDKIETLGHRFAMDYTPGMFKPYAPGLYGYVEFKISRGAITWAWKPELNEEQATKGNWTTTRIQAVYMTVVEFILWYNKTQENEY